MHRTNVRKDRAPLGAFRLVGLDNADVVGDTGQKAPSTKRCITTGGARADGTGEPRVRKHRAPKGALRHVIQISGTSMWYESSESTDHHKAH